jgi:hypothetical protein
MLDEKMTMQQVGERQEVWSKSYKEDLGALLVMILTE